MITLRRALLPILVLACAVPAHAQTAPAGCVSIASYGGATTKADNSAALKSAIAASGAISPCVYVPPGTWNFAAAYSYTFPTAAGSFTLAGAGADVTNLTWTGSSAGLVFNYLGYNDSVHVRDLSLVSSTAGTATALSLMLAAANPNPAYGALSDVRSVTVRGGTSAPSTQYWGTGINVAGVSNVNFTALNVLGPTGAAYSSTGNGIVLGGTATTIGVDYNVSSSNLNYLGNGIVLGSYAQGLTVTQTNFTGNSYGIQVPAGANSLDQLAISNSQFNCQLEGLLVQSPLPNLQVHDNLFIVPNTGVGVQLNTAGLYTLSGNSFNIGSATAGAVYPIGMVLTASTVPGVITANIFDHMNVGIVLQSGTSNVNVQSNSYSNTSTAVSNAGTTNKVGGGSS